MTATQYLRTVADCLGTVEAQNEQGNALALDEAMRQCVARLLFMRGDDGTVHLVGNGGSAAAVAHAQNDFVKAAGIRAHVCQDVPLLTAYANDLDYELSASKPLEVWLRSVDVLVAVSSSGESANILHAVEAARRRQAGVMTLSGFEPTNRLRQMGDLNFYVPSMDYGHVELTHAALLHHITDEVARA